MSPVALLNESSERCSARNAHLSEFDQIEPPLAGFVRARIEVALTEEPTESSSG